MIDPASGTLMIDVTVVLPFVMTCPTSVLTYTLHASVVKLNVVDHAEEPHELTARTRQ